MIQGRGLTRDKVLCRILKNKSPTVNSICEKLNQNVKNIVLLSEDELCELWQHIMTTLQEAQKLYTQTLKNSSKYTKECNVMIKMIRTITAMAMETITQSIFIPNVLLQNTMLLHSAVLPNIKDEQAKNEISCLLETWWKLDLTWKEKVIINVLKYLIQSCKSSLQHVKRLYEIRRAISLLKCPEDIEEMLRLVREKTIMSLDEGRLIILYLFTLGEQYILGIHNNVKGVLQSMGHSYISRYADLYVTAWSNAKGKSKNFIVKNCLQDIVFHCFRAYRDASGRGKLGKNLLYFLVAMHDNKNGTARLMIHRQCKSLLWEHLKAPGSYIRCNAAEILFVTSSIHYTCAPKDRNILYLRSYYNATIDLLKDPNHEVRLVTMNCIFKVLEKHWKFVPNDTIQYWLNVFLEYTKNANNSQLRANVFIGLTKILNKERSRKILTDFLPNFSNSIFDEDRDVIEALIKVLWCAQNHVGIPFWNIIPLSYIIDRLETTQEIFLLQELMKLVWLRISMNNINCDKIVEEIEYIGLKNINVIRRFCFRSQFVMTWDMSSKIIKNTLLVLKEEIKCLSVTNTRKNKSVKGARLSDKETTPEHETGSEEEVDDVDKYKHLQVYIDITAMLLVKNVNNKSLWTNEDEMNILQEIANIFTNFPTIFKETPVNESAIFLLSLIPPTYFSNKKEVMETLIQQLYDVNTSDDAILTVIHVLIKWEKGHTILLALTNLFKKSLDIHMGSKQKDSNSMNAFNIHQKGLELSLRILKYISYVEFQSALTEKYHEDLLKFWETLHVLRTFVQKALDNRVNVYSLITKDIILQFFKQYISIIFLLHKTDVFDASEHFSEMLWWIKKAIVPHTADAEKMEKQIAIDLLTNVFDISNQLLKKQDCTPKLCCDIVLLYCSCLSTSSSIVILNHAFDGILNLLEFSKIAFKNNEPNLLNIVVPNFVCVTMVSLTRCNQDELTKQTNNLRMLPKITHEYFSVMKSVFHDQQKCLPYITMMFNAAISSISTKMTQVFQGTSITEENVLITEFPYLAKKILSILNTKKYQKLSVQVLSKTITSYEKIDMLSALVIIHRMLDTPNKGLSSLLKNITVATKLHCQKQSYNTPFDRSIHDSMNMIMDTILEQLFLYEVNTFLRK